MPAPIAVQLYSLRDALQEDYEGVIRRLAEVGYAGVEPAGFTGIPEQAASLFESLGLAVPSVHLSLPVGEDREETLNVARRLGARTIVSGGLAPERFESRAGLDAVCDLFNEANAAATEAGFRFAIHNHWWEFEPLDGVPRYQLMLERLDPSVLWEIDTYWVKAAGMEPERVLAELGARAPLLHIKDGPAVRGEPMVAVGQGTLDFNSIIPAHAAHTEWLIVELDNCATDMFTAVAESYRYLVDAGLAAGRAQ